MIIRMLSSMSSGRHDGRVWPPAGVNFEVPDWEGEDLVRGGNAVMVIGSDEEKQAKAVAAEPAEPAEPAEDSEDSGPQEDGQPPRPAASKQEWIDWAVSQGANDVDAMNATKQQLMETYGQRT